MCDRKFELTPYSQHPEVTNINTSLYRVFFLCVHAFLLKMKCYSTYTCNLMDLLLSDYIFTYRIPNQYFTWDKESFPGPGISPGCAFELLIHNSTPFLCHWMLEDPTVDLHNVLSSGFG